MVLLGEANAKGVPWPMPDIIKLKSYHYLDVFNTLLVQSPETNIYSTARGWNAFFGVAKGFSSQIKCFKWLYVLCLCICVSALWKKHKKPDVAGFFFFMFGTYLWRLFVCCQLTVKCDQFIFGFCFHFYLVISMFFSFSAYLTIAKMPFFHRLGGFYVLEFCILCLSPRCMCLATLVQITYFQYFLLEFHHSLLLEFHDFFIGGLST